MDDWSISGVALLLRYTAEELYPSDNFNPMNILDMQRGAFEGTDIHAAIQRMSDFDWWAVRCEATCIPDKPTPQLLADKMEEILRKNPQILSDTIRNKFGDIF